MENSSNIDKSASTSSSFASFQIKLLKNFDYIKNQQEALQIEVKSLRQQLTNKQQTDLIVQLLKTHYKTEQLISIINNQLKEIKDLNKLKEDIKEIHSTIKK